MGGHVQQLITGCFVAATVVVVMGVWVVLFFVDVVAVLYCLVVCIDEYCIF